MQVTTFKNRKPTDEVFDLEAINDSSAETLVKSLGEEQARMFLVNGTKTTWANQLDTYRNGEKPKSTEEITEIAKTWKPSGRTRTAKTPEQRVKDLAAKLGLTNEQLAAMVSGNKPTTAGAKRAA